MHNNSKFKKVIGLEIHCQIATKSKLFSSAIIDENAEPNTNVNWLDAGFPGTLPVPNKEAVIMALRTALALNMKINKISIFDRKHYFYQDLPLGYQISQFYHPIGLAGYLEFEFGKIRINRLHIEADAGKSVYSNGDTFVDLNRSGVGLMEIVTEPDFTNAKDVIEFLKELRSILLTIGTCRCNLEEGNMRADVNVSIHKEGEPLGTRCEIKNLNSFKSIIRAIDYEAELQEKTILSGQKITQKTKLFDIDNNETRELRDKEDCIDYRYFPDPDLLPVVLEEAVINDARAALPKLPSAIRKEYMDYGINKQQAYAIAEHPIRVSFFQQLTENFEPGMIVNASNWMVTELFGKLIALNVNFEDFIAARPWFAKEFRTIIHLCESRKISRPNAKETLDHLLNVVLTNEQCDITNYITKAGYLDKTDSGEILAIVRAVLKNNADEVKRYKAGKTNLLMFFVGSVIKELKGKCDPEEIKLLVIAELDSTQE